MQWRRTYIAFEHEQGLVLIDQHSAHERVLFERFMGVLERGEAPAQRLLFPLTLHLGPADRQRPTPCENLDADELFQHLLGASGREVGHLRLEGADLVRSGGDDDPGRRQGTRRVAMRHWITSFRLLTDAAKMAAPRVDCKRRAAHRRSL